MVTLFCCVEGEIQEQNGVVGKKQSFFPSKLTFMPLVS